MNVFVTACGSADEVVECGHHLDAGEAATAHDERERGTARCLVPLGVGALKHL